MAPAWSLTVVNGVAEALPRPAGLLLGVIDGEAHQATLLGAVPLPPCAGAGDVAEVAAKALELVPNGVVALGAYGPGLPPQPPQPAAAHGCPPVGVADDGGGFTLGGTPADASAVAIPTGGLAPPGFVALRAHADLLLRAACPPGGGATPAALARAFAGLAGQLSGPQLVFLSDDRPNAAPALLTQSSDAPLADALPPGPWVGEPCASLTPLAASSAPAGALPAPGPAPVFEYSPAPTGSRMTEVVLCLDALALVPVSAPSGRTAASTLAAALRRQLDAAERLVAAWLSGGGGGGGGPALPGAVRAYHFRPPGWALPVTALYPLGGGGGGGGGGGSGEDALLPARQALHALLGLPPDVPMLRFANALKWGAGGGGGAGGVDSEGRAARLRDVHVGLALPAIGGAPSLIRGSYEYCHYMQDRFNDSGWGCAYRSLQTIVSWFRLQMYTEKPVPSHREIQQLLVKLGDKDASFIGSANWIGAIELSYVLGEYLGVTCKIMTVNRGADIPSRARELAAHFESQGTPVMIGGGVLAYTLLGVRFDELTGDAAFLILDPHYTGGEDLRKIQGGTWVAWKTPADNAAAGGPLFVADTFYNFLLPQRPNTV